MNKINVVGIGPGSPEYITPAAAKAIAGSGIIIGGERNLESLDTAGKEVMKIGSHFNGIIDFIRERAVTNTVSVIVSGDPGFYSMLGFLKKHFTAEELNVVPGISPVQYMFSKLGMTWEDARLASLHGRECDITGIVRSHRKTAFLTDKKTGFREIAKTLDENGLGKRTMYVGTNLSYGDEMISKGSAEEMAGSEKILPLAVVVVIDE